MPLVYNGLMGLKINLLGVRGSLATPFLPIHLEERLFSILSTFHSSKAQDPLTFLETLPSALKGGYGGNTCCVHVESFSRKTKKKGTEIIIDAGTGLRHLNNQYMLGGCAEGKGDVHLFFTHFHWDHIMGLPFFPPIYIPGNKIHLYAVQDDLPMMMETLFRRPFFPVEFKMLSSQIIFHQLKPRKVYDFGDMTITPYQLDHPDPCWGYKVESDQKTYAHCVDTEAIRLTKEELGQDLPLYQNVDLMLFDAQYSIKEAQEKRNWGHSSAPKGLEIALREKIKHVVFVHHDPFASDEQTSKMAREAAKYFESIQGKNQNLSGQIKWEIGQEGQSFILE
jgi:phosphoribosyl 1,2-cyclic phosphodiesterase